MKAIPKIIHYCWFGKSPKPEIFEKCYQSWKTYAPDYEIIEWNEENFDIQKFPFVKQAYDNKKYAFVSDVARLSIVYEHGGVYLDTDVELRAPLDTFLKDECFFFFQNIQYVNTGLGFGAVAMQPALKHLLNDYANRSFDMEHMAELSCPRLNTAVFERMLPGFLPNNTQQILCGIHFYDTTVYDIHAVHHDQFSWMSEEQRDALRFMRKRRPNYRLREALRNPKIFLWFDKFKLKKLRKLYLFAVYDLIEYGFLYWCYRIFQKIKSKFKYTLSGR